MFAQSVVDDYSLPQSSTSTITKAIQEQLSDFKAHTIESVEDDGFFGTTTARSADEDIWWERWRNGLRTDSGTVRRKKRKHSPGPGPSNHTTSYITVESGGRPAVNQNQDDDSVEEMRILIKVSGGSWTPQSAPVSFSRVCISDMWRFAVSWILSSARSDSKINSNGTYTTQTEAPRSVSQKCTAWNLV